MNAKKIFYVTVVLLLFLSACSGKMKMLEKATIPREKKMDNASLKAMTYNVHHCNPPGKSTTGVIDIAAISRVIELQRPDLVALQEIDDHTTRSGSGINEAAEIAKRLGFHYYFGKAIDYAAGGYGIAILSRFPLCEMKTVYLPKTADQKSEQRVLVTARISLPSGRFIRFGCTHLDVISAPNRILQVEEINKVAALDSLPFLLGGDFNATVNSKAIHLLDERFQRSCTLCAATIPSDHPKETIDYLAFDKKYPMEIKMHTVIEETDASDHRPVVAVFKLLK